MSYNLYNYNSYNFTQAERCSEAGLVVPLRFVDLNAEDLGGQLGGTVMGY